MRNNQNNNNTNTGRGLAGSKINKTEDTNMGKGTKGQVEGQGQVGQELGNGIPVGKDGKPLTKAQQIQREIDSFLKAGGLVQEVQKGSSGQGTGSGPKAPKEPKAPKGVLKARELVELAEREPSVENLVEAFKAIKSFLAHVWFQVWIDESEVLKARLMAITLPGQG